MSIVIINSNNIHSSNLNILINVIYNNFSHINNEPELNHNKTNIRKTLQSSDPQLFFVMVNKKVAAYLLGEIIKLDDGRKVLYVTYLYTSSQFRNKGFASKLLNTAEHIKNTKHIDGIMLTCESTNKKNYNFYVNKGFMPDILLRTYDKYEVMYK